MIQMIAMPIYDKIPFKIFFSRTKKQGTLKLGIKHPCLETYQICSMMFLSLPLTFLERGQIDFPMCLYEKNIEKSIFRELLNADVLYLAHIVY